MSNNTEKIPQGWAAATLADVTEHHSGNSKLIKGRLSSHAGEKLFAAFSATGQDVWRDGYEEEGDAVIVSAVGARCGKCFLASGKWSAIANTHVVRPRDHAINVRFLWYRLNNEHFWIRSGAAQPFVVVTKTLEREFPLPPLAEQERIVTKVDEFISELDSGIKELEEAQVELKRYRASVLAAACSGKLVPTEAEVARSEGRSYETGSELLTRILKERHEKWNGRGKYKEPASPDTTGLSALPEGWTWASVAQLSLVGTGATPNRGDSSYYHNGDIAWITSGALNNLQVKEASEFVTEKALKETNLTLYPAGTLLLAMYGEGKTRGKCSELMISATTNQAIAAVQVMDSEVKNYLKIFFWKNYEDVRGHSSGGVQPNLNLSIVASIAVPLPPLAEQKRIVSEVECRLSVADEIEQVLSANLQRAEHLRQSILQQAFTGKLVPQDSSDEPAAALLERINAKRVDAAPRTKVISKTRGRSKTAIK
ncbi:MAG TPA: restriction endonuclease subunit S [Candidatus Paceibacterota bacterium]|nr:restriction endonuclease subunit S [Candidatus Paceibacterota bacterium]